MENDCVERRRIDVLISSAKKYPLAEVAKLVPYFVAEIERLRKVIHKAERQATECNRLYGPNGREYLNGAIRTLRRELPGYTIPDDYECSSDCECKK